MLETINPSPVVQLSKAMQNILAVEGLKENHVYFTALGDLYVMQDNNIIQTGVIQELMSWLKILGRKNLLIASCKC